MKLKRNSYRASIFFAMAFLVLSGGKYRPIGRASAQLKPDACTNCHAEIAEILPRGHGAVIEPSPPACKKCHRVGGPAKTFEWLSHYKHYRIATGAPECGDCHRLLKKKAAEISESRSSAVSLPAEIADGWGPFFKSWAVQGYMDNAHAQKGVICRSCHGSVPAFEVPELEKCLSCHKGYAPPLGQNSGSQPDPHRSHLESPPCTLCHKAHEKSVNYCNSGGCHQYNFNFPYPNKK